MRELILSNNKRLYHGAQSAAERTTATADMSKTSVKQRAAGMEGGSDEDSDGDDGEGEKGGPGFVFRRRHTARTLILAPLSGAVRTF